MVMPTGRDVEREHRKILDNEAGRADLPPTGDEVERIASLAVSMRLIKGENVIKNHVMVALGLGLIPVPLFDVAMLVGNQVSMVHSIGLIYGQAFSNNRVKAVVLSLVSGSAPVLSVLGLSTGAKLMPGIGTLVGSGSVAVSGGALTYGVGRVFLRHFESGGTLLTLDAAKARSQLKREIRRGREVVADLKAKVGASAAPAAAGAAGRR